MEIGYFVLAFDGVVGFLVGFVFWWCGGWLVLLLDFGVSVVVGFQL